MPINSPQFEGLNAQNSRLRRNLQLIVIFVLCATIATLIFLKIDGALRRFADQASINRVMIESAIQESREDLLIEFLLHRENSIKIRLSAIERRIAHNLGETSTCLEFVNTSMKSLNKNCKNRNLENSSTVEIALYNVGSLQATVKVHFDPSNSLLYVFKSESVNLLGEMLLSIIIILSSAYFLDQKLLLPMLSRLQKDAGKLNMLNSIQYHMHDFKRPLEMIRLFNQSLKKSDSIEETQRTIDRFSKTIDETTQRLKINIQNVTTMCRDSQTSHEQIEIQELILKIHKEIALSQMTLISEINFSGEIKTTIYGDAIRLERAFYNLILNAVEESPSSEEIIVHISTFSEHFEIDIRNKGRAIPDESLPQIFETPFSSGKRGGTGLGLAIAKECIQFHKGQIVPRNIENFGVSMKVTIPRISNPNSAIKETQRSFQSKIGPNSRKISLLLLEDDLIFQDDFEKKVQSISVPNIDISLNVVETIEAAIDHINTSRPDMVICDLNLLALDNIEKQCPYKTLTKLFPGLEIVLYTNDHFSHNHSVLSVEKPASVASIQSVIKKLI